MPKISPELLSVLRCPVTGSPLAQDGEEVVVEAVRGFRANPGPGEYELFNGFNAAMMANPIPV